MAKSINQFLDDESEQVKELKAQLLEKDRILESYKKNHGQMEIFFNAVLASIKAMEPKPILYKPSVKRSASKVEAVMQITDAHMGAVQEAREIEGFNEFNPEICRARQLDYAERFCKWIDRHRLGQDINKVNVLVTGDLISGDIHQELQVTNAFPVTMQVVEAAKVLSEQLSIVCQNFEDVVVHFIGADNHGRLTRKPQAKQEGLNSLNYLVGVLAQAYTKKFPNLEFNVYPMHEKVVTCLNRNYLIAHGHGMKSWLGIPYYAAERKLGKEFQARMQLIMDQKLKMAEIGFNKMVVGHFHVPINAPMYSFCGSVQGTDAYDHKDGRYAPPSQAAWLIHERWKESGRVDFEL
jgi:hypothetical protein